MINSEKKMRLGIPARCEKIILNKTNSSVTHDCDNRLSDMTERLCQWETALWKLFQQQMLIPKQRDYLKNENIN